MARSRRTTQRGAGRRARVEQLESRRVMAADPGWAFGFAGPAFETDAATAIGPDGALYAWGSFSGTTDFDPGAGVTALAGQVGANDLYLAKYSTNGALVWAKRFGGTGNDYAGGLAFDSAGDLLVNGHFSSTSLTLGGTTLANQGNYDVFAGKVSAATGNFVWARGMGGAGQDTAYDVAVNAAGESYSVGTFRGSVDFDPSGGVHTITAAGGGDDADAFVWKLDASGNFAWARQLGGSLLENGHRVTLDGAGGVYAAGTYRGTVDFGLPGNPVVMTSADVDTADVFFVKLDEATGDAAWARQATGLAHVNAARIVADGAGKLYVAGGFQGTIDFGAGTPTLMSAGGTDAFASQWDTDGNLQWAESFAGAGETLVRTLKLDAAGSPLLAFNFDGAVDFDPGVGTTPLTSAGQLDGAALKLNPDGSLALVRQISGAGTTLAQGIAADSAGNLYVSGFFQGSATTPTGHTLSASGNGQFLMKLALADPATKFYTVDDSSSNRTYEYQTSGTAGDNSALAAANSAPRGAASTAAGDKVWVIDANRQVFVYDINGNLLGSWSAGSMASNATPEGIATNGTDVWIVDSKSDKVFRYAGAASRLSGSQNAASSFNLNGSNAGPKDIVTDGASLWVVNDSSTDKVFKYTTAGALLGSWTIGSANSAPTGITIDPTNVSDIWIVDNGTDRVYQYAGATSRTSGGQSPIASFALAAGNTNPQGIADPPPAGDAVAAADELYARGVERFWLPNTGDDVSKRSDAPLARRAAFEAPALARRVNALEQERSWESWESSQRGPQTPTTEQDAKAPSVDQLDDALTAAFPD